LSFPITNHDYRTMLATTLSSIIMKFSFACVSLLLAPVFITAKLSGASVDKYQHQLEERHLAGHGSVERRLTGSSSSADEKLLKMKEDRIVRVPEVDKLRENAIAEENKLNHLTVEYANLDKEALGPEWVELKRKEIETTTIVTKQAVLKADEKANIVKNLDDTIALAERAKVMSERYAISELKLSQLTAHVDRLVIFEKKQAQEMLDAGLLLEHLKQKHDLVVLRLLELEKMDAGSRLEILWANQEKLMFLNAGGRLDMLETCPCGFAD
jgi:hypothetical protein